MYDIVKNTTLYINTHKITCKQKWIALVSEEMAQSVKYLQHTGPELKSQHSHKSQMQATPVSFSTGETETRGSLGLADSSIPKAEALL